MYIYIYIYTHIYIGFVRQARTWAIYGYTSMNTSRGWPRRRRPCLPSVVLLNSCRLRGSPSGIVPTRRLRIDINKTYIQSGHFVCCLPKIVSLLDVLRRNSPKLPRHQLETSSESKEKEYKLERLRRSPDGISVLTRHLRKIGPSFFFFLLHNRSHNIVIDY